MARAERATDEAPEVGALLRGFRIAAGLTQEELAERTGLGVRSIQGVEGGERRPRRDTLRRLVDALDLLPSDRARLAALTHAGPRQPLLGARRDRVLDGPGEPRAGPGGPPGFPAPLSSFVGRGRELDEVARCLDTARLLTLTGPPGVGKTRLALAAAARLGSAFADGVRFIPLAAIRDPGLVLATIAQSVGIKGTEHRPLLAQVAEALGDSRVLLVLDNFEQVVAAGPALSELLEACPRLRVLVTSRIRLRVRGEREIEVSPLSLPEGGPGIAQSDAVSAVLRSEAALLFVERAREARADFVVTRENAPLIMEVCRRLDGSPLAIELAAAWVRTLSLPDLLARLADRLDLLTSGPADLPRRQQSWREAIAWSYELLGPDEQALFRRLAVFSGGFTFEAAEAVADARLATLTSLLDASLVQRLGGARAAEPRFAMLETIRDDAEERLLEAGEAVVRRSRHATYVLALAETARKTLGGPRQREGFDRLEAEHDNLRAALRFHLDQADVESALRLLGVVGWCWFARGHSDEVRRWQARILELARATGPATILANALLLLGRAAYTGSDNLVARAQLEESLSLFRQVGDRMGIAESLGMLGLLTRERGEYAVARGHLEESLELFRELGDARGVAAQLDRIGETAFYLGEIEAGRALVERALRVREQLGDPVYTGWPCAILGVIAHGTGDLVTARSFYDRSLAVWREHAYHPGIYHVLPYRAELALDEGDLAGARADLVEGLGLSRAQGEPREIASALEGFAGLAAARHDPARCLRLAGAAAALRETIGEPCTPDRQARLTCRLALAREALGEIASAAAGAEGREMTLEQAVAYALEGMG